MLRGLLAFLLLAAGPALAQHAHHGADHSAVHRDVASPAEGAVPTEPGQSAFAAIQEIVQILEADPATDWSRVNIEGLRQHLIDMNDVTLRAEVSSAPTETGALFKVTGTGSVVGSIRRMVTGHAATMNGVGGWTFVAADIEGGAQLSVSAPPSERAKVRALGFIGVLTRGMHHQMHHLMLARGGHPHG